MNNHPSRPPGRPRYAEQGIPVRSAKFTIRTYPEVVDIIRTRGTEWFERVIESADRRARQTSTDSTIKAGAGPTISEPRT